MRQKCSCGGWLEYTDTDVDEYGEKYDVYICIDCGNEYWLYMNGKEHKLEGWRE